MKFLTIFDYTNLRKDSPPLATVRVRDGFQHDACDWLEAQNEGRVFGVAGLFVFWDEELATIFKLRFG